MVSTIKPMLFHIHKYMAIFICFFLLQYVFFCFSDCCDVALEHINCTIIQANEYSANSTCVYCPSTAIFATESADVENVTAFAEIGNVTDSPVNSTTMASSEFVNTTSQPLMLVTNETVIYNTTKHFVSPAQEYFLWVLTFLVICCTNPYSSLLIILPKQENESSTKNTALSSICTSFQLHWEIYGSTFVVNWYITILMRLLLLQFQEWGAQSGKWHQWHGFSVLVPQSMPSSCLDPGLPRHMSRSQNHWKGALVKHLWKTKITRSCLRQ